MKNVKTLILLIVLCILPLVVGFHPSQQDEEPVHWEGAMDIVITGPKFAAEGELVTRYHLDVNWKEAKRVDVRGDKGNLTGQFILLEENGSHWEGNAFGEMTQGEGCSLVTTTYAGSGSGTDTLEFGWVYYSMADDDPLADVLPNGAYHIACDHDETIKGNMTFTFIICSVNQEVTQTNPYQFLGIG